MGMGEIPALEGFKGQQVVTIFFPVPPHPLLQLVFLCGLSSQLESLELYRPQTLEVERNISSWSLLCRFFEQM